MDLVNHLEGRSLFAVPKKGRLQQAALDLLAGSDLQFRRDNRLDVALVKNHHIALIFLNATDIPKFVAEGVVDLGITGLDQIKEYEAVTPPTQDTTVEEVLDLGFGSCTLEIQVPENGPYSKPEDLIGRNICTSFVGLTKQYFANLEAAQKPGITNGNDTVGEHLRTKIGHLSGSVEVACALGMADGIVDLVESGETMKSHGLKAIKTVVESKAVLIKSQRSSNPKLVDKVASRIQGVVAAQQFVLCQYNIPRHILTTATRITPGKRAPTITQLEEADWVAVSSMVERKKIATAMDELASCGATDILVLSIANSR